MEGKKDLFEILEWWIFPNKDRLVWLQKGRGRKLYIELESHQTVSPYLLNVIFLVFKAFFSWFCKIL